MRACMRARKERTKSRSTSFPFSPFLPPSHLAPLSTHVEEKFASPSPIALKTTLKAQTSVSSLPGELEKKGEKNSAIDEADSIEKIVISRDRKPFVNVCVCQ